MMTATGPQLPQLAFTRRTAMTLMSAGAVAAVTGCSLLEGEPDVPWLWSEEQEAAERMLLALEDDSDVKAIRAEMRSKLASSPRGAIGDAQITLDESLSQWTRSLIFCEVLHRPTRPMLLWMTDDTPREWNGYELGGVGMSGDNPDAIYCTAGIDGGGRYEILGKYHEDSRPVQFLMEVNAGDMGQPQNVMPVSDGEHADIHNTSMLSDRELVVAEDGTFRITLGGEGEGPNHLAIPESGYAMVGVRNIMSNWTDKAPQLTINRLDEVAEEPWTLETVKQRVVDDLEGYIGFWSNFPNIWFGGIKPNERSEPMGRPGAWGFVGGMNFSLGEGEVFLVTTDPGAAKYTGFQIINPWMIAPDARNKQVCLNLGQTTKNADGTITYVIAKEDPGVANWLDTDGMSDGIGIFRWQQVPPDMSNEGLIRDFRVIKRNELDAMTEIPRVTADQRKEQVEARFAAYSSRAT
ncbi:MAG: hypothetical protein P8J20_08400 [Novosphingobium sp.]|nr:hypothetical protein [Novosphingobium sp.]